MLPGRPCFQVFENVDVELRDGRLDAWQRKVFGKVYAQDASVGRFRVVDQRIQLANRFGVRRGIFSCCALRK